MGQDLLLMLVVGALLLTLGGLLRVLKGGSAAPASTSETAGASHTRIGQRRSFGHSAAVDAAAPRPPVEPSSIAERRPLIAVHNGTD